MEVVNKMDVVTEIHSLRDVDFFTIVSASVFDFFQNQTELTFWTS